MNEKESEFLDRIASVLEVPSATRETELRSAPYWSSLTAFALIVTLEQRYGAKLTLAGIDGMKTVGDLMAAAGMA